MSRTAVDVLREAYEASLGIVRGQQKVGDVPSPETEAAVMVAASNLAICLFSYEAEAASLGPPPDEDDETIEEG